MENLLNQLYDIESAASSVLEQTAAKKKELAAKQEERILAFDGQLRQRTEETIRRRREQMNAQIEAELAREKALTEKQLSLMEEEYVSNHTALAGQLFAELMKE